MIRTSLCDYSDTYIHVKGTIKVTNTAAEGTAPTNRDREVTFKNCSPFINWTSRWCSW